MTDGELLLMCRDHYQMLQRLSRVAWIKHEGKRVSLRKVLDKETSAALDKINEHFDRGWHRKALDLVEG